MLLPDPHRVRPPAVAGLFYPAEPGALERVVRSHLAGVDATLTAGPAPKAVIAPHAGYVYSGPVAGSAFGRLPDGVTRVVVIGPSHRVPLRGLALPTAGLFDTPLGRLPVDAELAARVAALPQVTMRGDAHADEHSLEVELPFLQVRLGELTVLPLVVGAAAPDDVAEVLEAVWGGPETLVVVSSDLSHYHGYERARQLDRATAEAIVGLREPLAPEQACGAAAINGLLVVARRRGLTARRLDLRSSGDTAGDRLRVVGYGAFHFLERGDGAPS